MSNPLRAIGTSFTKIVNSVMSFLPQTTSSVATNAAGNLLSGNSAWGRSPTGGAMGSSTGSLLQGGTSPWDAEETNESSLSPMMQYGLIQGGLGALGAMFSPDEEELIEARGEESRKSDTHQSNLISQRDEEIEDRRRRNATLWGTSHDGTGGLDSNNRQDLVRRYRGGQ